MPVLFSVTEEGAPYDFECVSDHLPAGEFKFVDVRAEALREQVGLPKALALSVPELLLQQRMKNKALVVFDGAYSVKQSAQLCAQLRSNGFKNVTIPHASMSELVRRFGGGSSAAPPWRFSEIQLPQVQQLVADGMLHILMLGEQVQSRDLAGAYLRTFPSVDALQRQLQTDLLADVGGVAEKFLLVLPKSYSKERQELASLDKVFWINEPISSVQAFLERMQAGKPYQIQREATCGS